MTTENEKNEGAKKNLPIDLNPVSIEMLDVVDLNNRKRYLAQIILNEKLVNERLEEYKNGIYRSKIYASCVSIAYNLRICTFNCFVQLPSVKRNAVGSIVANNAFIVAELLKCDFQIGMELKIQELKLLQEVDRVPYL